MTPSAVQILSARRAGREAALLGLLMLGCSDRASEPARGPEPSLARAAVDDTGFACLPGESDRTLYLDADGDGHGDPARSYVGCEVPAGYVAYPDDCNDAEPRAWSAAPEVSCDGVDNNCDGEEPACLAVGIEAAAAVQLQGAPGQDLRFNGWVGSDFTGDGAADLLLRRADGAVQVLSLAGHAAGARLAGEAEGRSLLPAPAGAQGAWADGEGGVWWSSPGEGRGEHLATLRRAGSGDDLAVVTGHLGVADAGPGRLLVRTAEGASLLRAARGVIGADRAALQVVHAACAYDFGQEAGFAGDWDGDGVEDLLVSAPDPSACDDRGSRPFGALVSGAATGRFDVATAEGLLTLEQSVDSRNPARALRGVAPLGDLNGDGHSDLGLLHRQGLAVVLGPRYGRLPVDTGGDLTLADDLAGLSDVREVQPLPGAEGTRLAVRFGWPAERNVLALFEGVSPEPRALWMAERFDTQTGITGLQAGDFDGDGQADLLVHAAADRPGSRSGRLYALFSSVL